MEYIYIYIFNFWEPWSPCKHSLLLQITFQTCTKWNQSREPLKNLKRYNIKSYNYPVASIPAFSCQLFPLPVPKSMSSPRLFSFPFSWHLGMHSSAPWGSRMFLPAYVCEYRASSTWCGSAGSLGTCGSGWWCCLDEHWHWIGEVTARR